MRTLVVFSLAFALAGCFRVDNPPNASIVGLTQGKLADPKQPLVLAFDEPINLASLRVRIVAYDPSIEDHLDDQPWEPPGESKVYFDGYDGTGGTATLDPALQNYQVAFSDPPPVAAQLGVVIEPGLADAGGVDWKVRQVLKFAYDLKCSAPKPTAFPPNGKFFWLVSVEKPVPVQLRLFADVRVDPMTGVFKSQFTDGVRNKQIDCTKYGLSCAATEVCRTLPAPACVLPTEKASTVDEYPDFVAQAAGDVGFTFAAEGCVADLADGGFTFANKPTEIITTKPQVTVHDVALAAAFKFDAAKVLRGNGALSAPQVWLGMPNGTAGQPGSGTHVERQVPDDWPGIATIPPPAM
jgi:hypothetical protein